MSVHHNVCDECHLLIVNKTVNLEMFSIASQLDFIFEIFNLYLSYKQTWNLRRFRSVWRIFWKCDAFFFNSCLYSLIFFKNCTVNTCLWCEIWSEISQAYHNWSWDIFLQFWDVNKSTIIGMQGKNPMKLIKIDSGARDDP